MCSLSEPLMDFLRNEDIEVVKMSLSVFTNILMNKDILTSCPTAPKLAAALRPLFDSVRLCAPSHGPWLLPTSVVPCGLLGLENPVLSFFLSNRTTIKCGGSPLASTKM